MHVGHEACQTQEYVECETHEAEEHVEQEARSTRQRVAM